MHKIVILALHGLIPFDLASACEVFSRVRVPGLPAPYEVIVCGEAPSVATRLFDLHTRWNLSHAGGAHTLIVPGIEDIDAPIPAPVLAAIKTAATEGARIASICTGAFALAASGPLDGQRATTHWMAAGELARRFPKIAVDPNVLFIDNGKPLTSATAAAGLDLCRHMVRNDYGAAVSARLSSSCIGNRRPRWCAGVARPISAGNQRAVGGADRQRHRVRFQRRVQGLFRQTGRAQSARPSTQLQAALSS
jgi:transcriptional regulator GlxA family with amidase domain